jgi:hypothetical protein
MSLDQWIFFGERSPIGDTVLWKHNILSQILCFWEKVFRQKATENWFFGGWCRHIYAYWLQFSGFLEINSPVNVEICLGMLATLATSGIWKKSHCLGCYECEGTNTLLLLVPSTSKPSLHLWFSSPLIVSVSIMVNVVLLVSNVIGFFMKVELHHVWVFHFGRWV